VGCHPLAGQTAVTAVLFGPDSSPGNRSLKPVKESFGSTRSQVRILSPRSQSQQGVSAKAEAPFSRPKSTPVRAKYAQGPLRTPYAATTALVSALRGELLNDERSPARGSRPERRQRLRITRSAKVRKLSSEAPKPGHGRTDALQGPHQASDL
jgi:hypothetical protein